MSDQFDQFLRTHVSPVPAPAPDHEKQLMNRIIKYEPQAAHRPFKFSPASWVGGFIAAAASLSLYIWSAYTKPDAMDSIALPDAPEVAAVNILVESFDAVDESIAGLPESYVDMQSLLQSPPDR